MINDYSWAKNFVTKRLIKQDVQADNMSMRIKRKRLVV